MFQPDADLLTPTKSTRTVTNVRDGQQGDAVLCGTCRPPCGPLNAPITSSCGCEAIRPHPLWHVRCA
jgi:hypothetical protein